MSDVWMHIGTGIVPTTSSGTVDVMGPTGMGTPKAVLVMMMALQVGHPPIGATTSSNGVAALVLTMVPPQVSTGGYTTPTQCLTQ